MGLSLTLADILVSATVTALAVASFLDLASRPRRGPRRARAGAAAQEPRTHRGVRVRITDSAGRLVADMDSDLLHLVARVSAGGRYVTHLVRTDLGLMASEPEPAEYALRVEIEPVQLPDDDDQDHDARRRWPRIVEQDDDQEQGEGR